MMAPSAREPPRALLIVGRPPQLADVALRRILHAKEPKQALVILDHDGQFGRQLNPRNRGNLERAPLTWVDLANRPRPVALFRLAQGPHLHHALTVGLGACLAKFAPSVSRNTLLHVVETACRLADGGTITLGAVTRAIRLPALNPQARRDAQLARELEEVGRLLAWLLAFPAVWALSEGNNPLDLGRALALGHTVWLELPVARFERDEHWAVSTLVETALLTALAPSVAPARGAASPARPPMVVHGLPRQAPLLRASNACEAKQITVVSVPADGLLPGHAQNALSDGADCWVIGGSGTLRPTKNGQFPSAEDCARLARLKEGEVWVRAGGDGRAVTTRVKASEDVADLAHGHRTQAARRLQVSPVRQYGSAWGNEQPRPRNPCMLFAALCHVNTLLGGWQKVKARHKQSSGCDRVTIERFGQCLDRELEDLAAELREGRYRCRPLQTLRIPKPDGDFRVLRVACVRDRVVQSACLQLLEPLFEPHLSPYCFAYRPGRGAQHALAAAQSLLRAGHVWMVTADIRKCFDSIDHEILLRLVEGRVGDDDILDLLRQWLTADVFDVGELTPAEVGVPQGESISPLLANVYLDPMDKAFEAHGIRFVRYADDYLLMCRTEAEAIAGLGLMQEFLAESLRLSLKPAKTQYRHADQGVEFLGFEIWPGAVKMPVSRMARALDAVAGHFAALTHPAQADAALGRMSKVNALIRGVRNYYQVDGGRQLTGQLRYLDARADKLAGDLAAEATDLRLLWSMRERFAAGADAPSEAVSAVLGTYPQESAQVTADPAGDLDADTVAPPPASPSADVEKHWFVESRRLHVTGHGVFASVQGAEIILRRKRSEAFRTPIGDVDMVFLEGHGIAVSTELTMALCERDVAVVYAPVVGRPSAIIQPLSTLRSGLRQQQVLRRGDTDVVGAGLEILSAKVTNQAAVLKYFGRYRRRLGAAPGAALDAAAAEIRAIGEQIGCLNPSGTGIRAQAMGHEGRAAAKYWQALQCLIPENLGYTGRVGRHATDPFNSAVNYVYALLYGEVWRAVIRAGLDPYFGLMHGTERDQGSLVFDLIEEYRAPFGDRLVLGLLGRGFDMRLDKAGRIPASSRRKMAAAFHRQWQRKVRALGAMRSPREILERQVASVRRLYTDQERYKAFRFKW